mmetsp:Transcript_62012/g.196059  ORF Transcript_62012/g.196059 Transcript_62012/m.196059 type:complete len:478 (-) Transcript_62012:149-1582(-)
MSGSLDLPPRPGPSGVSVADRPPSGMGVRKSSARSALSSRGSARVEGDGRDSEQAVSFGIPPLPDPQDPQTRWSSTTIPKLGGPRRISGRTRHRNNVNDILSSGESQVRIPWQEKYGSRPETPVVLPIMEERSFPDIREVPTMCHHPRAMTPTFLMLRDTAGRGEGWGSPPPRRPNTEAGRRRLHTSWRDMEVKEDPIFVKFPRSYDQLREREELENLLSPRTALVRKQSASWETTDDVQAYHRSCDKMSVLPSPTVARQLQNGGRRLRVDEGSIGPAGAVALAGILPTAWLTHVDFSGNKLGDHCGVCIAMALHHSTRVRDLSVARCGLRQCTRELADLLAANRSITRLDVSGNMFGDQVKLIFRAVAGNGTNGTLRSLDVSETGLGDPAVKAMCHVLQSETKLTILNVGGNRILPHTWRQIVNAMCQNVNLRELDVSGNHLGSLDDVIRLLVDSHYLEVLDISNGKIETEWAESI